MSVTTTTGRKPNVQPNGLVSHLTIEVFLGDQALGAITAPQEDMLSKSGNVLYRGRIRSGWQLPGDPSETLAALRFVVNGVEAHQSDTGVHLTSPSVRKDKVTGVSKEIPGTGGELIVCNTSVIDASTDGSGVRQIINVFAKRLKAKAGKDLGYSLRVQNLPIGQPGEQVIGEVTGLVVTS